MWARQAFLGSDTLLSELPAIGRTKQVAAIGSMLPAHAHENAYEFVLVVSGRFRWFVEGEQHTLVAGQLTMTRPGETHGAIDEVLEAGEILWCQARLDSGGAFGLTNSTRGALNQQLHQANRTCKAKAFHRYHLLAILDEHLSGLSRVDLVRSHAACFIDGVAASLDIPQEDKMDARVERAIRYLRTVIDQSVLVADVAEVVGVSENWLHQLFKRSMGISIGEWLAHERIERAKSLLNHTTKPVTEIAFELGYSSSQYFATVFRRHTGQTPMQYRLAVSKKAHSE